MFRVSIASWENTFPVVFTAVILLFSLKTCVRDDTSARNSFAVHWVLATQPHPEHSNRGTAHTLNVTGQ